MGTDRFFNIWRNIICKQWGVPPQPLKHRQKMQDWQLDQATALGRKAIRPRFWVSPSLTMPGYMCPTCPPDSITPRSYLQQLPGLVASRPESLTSMDVSRPQSAASAISAPSPPALAVSGMIPAAAFLPPVQPLLLPVPRVPTAAPRPPPSPASTPPRMASPRAPSLALPPPRATPPRPDLFALLPQFQPNTPEGWATYHTLYRALQYQDMRSDPVLITLVQQGCQAQNEHEKLYYLRTAAQFVERMLQQSEVTQSTRL